MVYRKIPLRIASDINDTDLKLIDELECEYRRERNRYPGEGYYLTIEELSEELEIDKSNVSRRATVLEDLGLIEKAKAGREVRVQLSSGYTSNNGVAVLENPLDLSVKNGEDGE